MQTYPYVYVMEQRKSTVVSFYGQHQAGWKDPKLSGFLHSGKKEDIRQRFQRPQGGVGVAGHMGCGAQDVGRHS